MNPRIEHGHHLLAALLRFGVVFLAICLSMYWYGVHFGHRVPGDLYSQNVFMATGALLGILAEMFVGTVLGLYVLSGLVLATKNKAALHDPNDPIHKLNVIVGAVLLPLNFLVHTGFASSVPYSDTLMAIPLVCWVFFNLVYRVSDRVLAKAET